MNRIILNRIAVVLFFISFISISAKGSELEWLSYNDGLNKAKNEKKILLIDFYTDWCGWCKKMDANTYTNKKVIDYLNKYFVVVKLNPEKDKGLVYEGQNLTGAQFAQMAGVSGYPSTGFFHNGVDFMGVIPGYLDDAQFIDLLTKVVDAVKSAK
ncbi:MAG: DUF255 domain-containing protein [Melioribacteraceae bacterium]|nr:DUF255 domain-containing protein [Melioribacteraceae bacterium]MCO6472607.1 DUF255 domain-containing protein [Melioribacteraceae bacterium]MDD3559094.1 DUF255 domain-containing protein [Melioribacteraceae bacterium]